jgi:hypothetical protein
MAGFLMGSLLFSEMSRQSTMMIVVLLISVVSAITRDESIADRCTPLAIIRPSEKIWIASKTTSWADISEIHEQLRTIVKLAKLLNTELTKLITKVENCDTTIMAENLMYSYVTGDVFSVIVGKEDALGEILHKTNSYNCMLPKLTQTWIGKVNFYLNNISLSESSFTHVIGLISYMPVGPNTGRIQTLNNERLLTIDDFTKVGLTEQPKGPEVKLAAFNAKDLSNTSIERSKLLNFDTSVSTSYICVKKIIFSKLTDTCSVPFKARIIQSLESGIRVSESLTNWANSMTNRLNSLPQRTVQTVTNAMTIRKSYFLEILIDHVRKLLTGGLEEFNEITEHQLRVALELTEKLSKKMTLDNQRRFVIDHTDQNALPFISLHVDYRVTNVDGKQFVYGDIFGPSYTILHLSLLDRLLDINGRSIIFKYLIEGENGDDTLGSLEHHPRDNNACEKYGSQLICKAIPASGSPDSRKCARTLLQQDQGGCISKVYSGQGLREIIAFCERKPRKYVVSPRLVIISHRCKNDNVKRFSYLQGTLQFDGECMIEFNDQPIQEVEEETKWTYDDIKQLAETQQDQHEQILAGGIYMIVGTGTVIFAACVTCCANLHKNKCECEPCSGNMCKCNCKSFNCFTCCCRRCNNPEPLGTNEESRPFQDNNRELNDMPVNLDP